MYFYPSVHLTTLIEYTKLGCFSQKFTETLDTSLLLRLQALTLPR